MSAKRARRGESHWVIDIRYLDANGKRRRYRRDAMVQTRAGRDAEERRLRENIAKFGSPHEPKAEPTSAPLLFEEAVALFKSGKAATKHKHSTRFAYDEIIRTRLLPKFSGKPLEAIGFEEVQSMDAEMVAEGLSPSRRRNVAVALRSILRAALDARKLGAMPKLPELPRKGKKLPPSMTAVQVDAILHVSPEPWRLVFALAAFAGLRAGEVRALRTCDVDLEAGLLFVRQSRGRGATSSPKSGDEREVPIAPRLHDLLESVPRDRELVCMTSHGEPWGDSGLLQAFRRAQRKAGVSGFRFHDLRHYFVSSLFRRGASAPAVQRLAGHAHLATTQRYAHVNREDLKATIGLLGGRGGRTDVLTPVRGRGNRGETAPAPVH